MSEEQIKEDLYARLNKMKTYLEILQNHSPVDIFDDGMGIGAQQEVAGEIKFLQGLIDKIESS